MEDLDSYFVNHFAKIIKLESDRIYLRIFDKNYVINFKSNENIRSLVEKFKESFFPGDRVSKCLLLNEFRSIAKLLIESKILISLHSASSKADVENISLHEPIHEFNSDHLPDTTFVIASKYSIEKLIQFNKKMISNKRGWRWVYADQDKIFVSPMFLEKKGSCFICFTRRLFLSSPNLETESLYYNSYSENDFPEVYPRSIFDLIDSFISKNSYSLAKQQDHLFVLDRESLESIKEFSLWTLECSSCKRCNLKILPKYSTAVEIFDALTLKYIGPISEITSNSLKIGNKYRFCSSSKLAFDFNGKVEVIRGHGVDKDSRLSKVKAAFEAVERLSLFVNHKSKIVTNIDTLSKSEKSYLDPSLFEVKVPLQQSEFAVRNDLMKLNALQPWILGTNEISKQEVLIPEYMSTLWHGRYWDVTSNGVAAGVDPMECKTKALLELIERDAICSVWWSKSKFKLLNLLTEEVGSNYVDISGEKICKLNIQYFLAKSKTNLPVVVARFRNKDCESLPAMVIGSACDFELSSAINRATDELWINLNLLLKNKTWKEKYYSKQLDFEIVGFQDHAYFYCSEENARQSDDYFGIDSEQIESLALIPKNYEGLLRNLSEQNCSIFSVDVTPKTFLNSMIKVYRIICPDFIPLNSRHSNRPVGHKYFQSQLGLSVERTNPLPHFLS